MHDDSTINGNRYIPFTELLRLEKTAAADQTFKSLTKAFSPGGGTSAYGGHVFAQAVWAAAHTVKEGFVVHVRVLRELDVDPLSPTPSPLMLCHESMSSASPWYFHASLGCCMH